MGVGINSTIIIFSVILLTIPHIYAQTESTSSIGSVRIENDVYEIKSGEKINIKISGNVIDPVGGAKLTIMITDPYGISTGLQLPITSSGYFETFWTLDDESPKGQYKITASYHSEQFGSVFFSLEEKKFSEKELLEARGVESEYTESETSQNLPSSSKVSIPVGSSVTGCEETSECYIPNKVIIQVSGEVTWSNDDTAAHTVTSGSPAEGPDGIFDSSLMMAGGSYSYKFNEPGSFSYFCMVHPWMIGTIIVGEGSEIIKEQTIIDTTETIQKNTEVNESAGILRIDKRIHDVSFGSSGKVEISGQVNTASWSRSGSASVELTITAPNGKPEKLTTRAERESGNFETSFPINYYSQRGIYKITGFYQNRCPSMQLCQPVDPVNFGTLSFVVRGDILSDYPLKVEEYGSYEQGLEKLQERRFEEALTLFNSALKEEPNNNEIQNSIEYTKAKIQEKKSKCSGSQIPNSPNWMDVRRECCALLPVDEYHDCSEGAGVLQMQWWRENDYNPMDELMHEQNRKLEQQRMEAQKQRAEQNQQKLLEIAPYFGIGGATTIAGIIAVKKLRKNEKPSQIDDDKNYKSKKPKDEIKWEGI